MTTDSHIEEAPTAGAPSPCIVATCEGQGVYVLEKESPEIKMCALHMTARDKDLDNSSESIYLSHPTENDEGNVLIDSMEEGWYIVNFGAATYGGFWSGPFATRELAEADMDRLGRFNDERLLYMAPKTWGR